MLGWVWDPVYSGDTSESGTWGYASLFSMMYLKEPVPQPMYDKAFPFGFTGEEGTQGGNGNTVACWQAFGQLSRTWLTILGNKPQGLT